MSAEPGLRLSDAQRFDWLRLWRSESIGPRTFRTLINRFGGARAALDALPRLAPSGKPVRIAGREEIERELELAAACGAVFIALGEENYPSLLRKIDTAPPVVAVRGALSVFTRPAVAIVGSRNASGAGLAFAERLSRGLVQAGYVIVSGLARGIDIRAHQTACGTGSTIAVLAGGHDKIYPAEHAAQLERLIETGAAISEMPFGWEARGRDFPRRNRIIAGLAQGSVIVEAASRSGSLITARFAAEQGREVFAVPGSPLDPRAEGTNELIRDGATLCTSAQDVIDALARQNPMLRPDLLSDTGPAAADEPLWEELDLPDVPPPPSVPAMAEPTQPPFASSTNRKTPEASRDATRDRIIALLGPSPISVDELARVAEATAREVRSILLELELAGRLERHGGDLVSSP